MATYGYSIRWTDAKGTKMQVSVDGCRSLAVAKFRCVLFAHSSGWRPRKWWEFWRWYDTSNRQILEA